MAYAQCTAIIFAGKISLLVLSRLISFSFLSFCQAKCARRVGKVGKQICRANCSTFIRRIFKIDKRRPRPKPMGKISKQQPMAARQLMGWMRRRSCGGGEHGEEDLHGN